MDGVGWTSELQRGTPVAERCESAGAVGCGRWAVGAGADSGTVQYCTVVGEGGKRVKAKRGSRQTPQKPWIKGDLLLLLERRPRLIGYLFPVSYHQT